MLFIAEYKHRPGGFYNPVNILAVKFFIYRHYYACRANSGNIGHTVFIAVVADNRNRTVPDTIAEQSRGKGVYIFPVLLICNIEMLITPLYFKSRA